MLELQDRLADLDFASSPDELRLTVESVRERDTTVYLGPGVESWLKREADGVLWLQTTPLREVPFYPIVLDVVESACELAPSALIADAAAALAPTWEELGSHRLSDAAASRPRWDDVQGADDDILERNLLAAVARAVASLGPRYGVIFRNPRLYDHASAFFVRRLLQECRATGLTVAMEASASLTTDPRYSDQLKGAHIVRGPAEVVVDPDPSELAVQLLALCPHGLPADLIEPSHRNGQPTYGTCEGPRGKRWAFVPKRISKVIRSQLTQATKRRLSARLFHLWNPSGWGYLRRAGHAIDAHDDSLILAQHTAYNYGLATIGRDFLYRQFCRLPKNTRAYGDDLKGALHAAVGAARLAPRVRSGGGVHAAVRHYHRALRFARDPAVEVEIIYGLANLNAQQRKPSALVQARRWYERGYELLTHINNDEDKLFAEIRLANGLALVEYHEGRNAESLALEQRARFVALSAEKNYPHLTRWALPIINANTAKLMEKRFANIHAAVKCLEENLISDNRIHQANSRMHLARFRFDEGKHTEVVELLGPLYGESRSVVLDEELELFGRLLYGISLSLVEDKTRCRQQLGRLTYLLHAVSNSSSLTLLAAIHGAAAECGQSA